MIYYICICRTSLVSYTLKECKLFNKRQVSEEVPFFHIYSCVVSGSVSAPLMITLMCSPVLCLTLLMVAISTLLLLIHM